MLSRSLSQAFSHPPASAGGIRGNAFVSGGFLQGRSNRVGTRAEGITHVCDFYATFASLAGVDPTDHKAAAAGLPPIDSLDLWPYLSGTQSESPRTEVFADADTLVLRGWKLVGANSRNASDARGHGARLPFACWHGPKYPNGSSDPKCHRFEDCVDRGGCLYDVENDPSEYLDLAASKPEKLRELQVRLAELQPTIFAPDRGADDGLADEAARDRHGGFWGPFL
jgi:arylsulfatase A-like enzyme